MFKLTSVIFTALLISGTANADNVEVYVTDLLDNTQNGYCLDIAKGKGASANPDDGLQAHTCYSPLGEVLVDQAFEPEKFTKGMLYMPEFDVCVQVSSTDVGAELELATCDGSDLQSWLFEGEGTIAPAAAPELCVTLAEETRTGRSDANQMKALTLQTCSVEFESRQTWANRTVD